MAQIVTIMLRPGPGAGEASHCQHTFTSLAQRNMRAIFVAARVDDEDFCHSEFSHCPNIVLWQNEENIWIK